MIRLLDLPGAQALEDFATLHGGPDNYQFDEKLEAFCIDQFKTNSVSVRSFSYPDDVSEYDDENEDEDRDGDLGEEECDDDADEDNAIRVTEFAMADDIVDYLLTLGYDLRNQMGQPLQITKRIALTIECVAKRVIGTPPDVEKADAERFGHGLEEQARKWKAGHR